MGFSDALDFGSYSVRCGQKACIFFTSVALLILLDSLALHSILLLLLNTQYSCSLLNSQYSCSLLNTQYSCSILIMAPPS